MDEITLQTKIEENLKLNSGLDLKRDYLGMSAIGKCPRQVVREYLNGKSDVSLRSHQASLIGYLIEDDVIGRLWDMGIAKVLEDSQKEVVAPFDARFRGHVDGETVDGDLLEIKTVTVAKFEKVKGTHMALTEHFAQVQVYMKYGRWRRCWIIYVCRDTFEHCVVKVNYLHTQGIKYELKAQRMLAHIDSGILPDCECRWCKE